MNELFQRLTACHCGDYRDCVSMCEWIYLKKAPQQRQYCDPIPVGTQSTNATTSATLLHLKIQEALEKALETTPMVSEQAPSSEATRWAKFSAATRRGCVLTRSQVQEAGHLLGFKLQSPPKALKPFQHVKPQSPSTRTHRPHYESHAQETKSVTAMRAKPSRCFACPASWTARTEASVGNLKLLRLRLNPGKRVPLAGFHFPF